MDKKYYHYKYQVQEFGETLDGHVTYGSERDESIVTDFIKEDLGDTYPDGGILELKLTAITDENGKKIK